MTFKTDSRTAEQTLSSNEDAERLTVSGPLGLTSVNRDTNMNEGKY